MISGLFPGAIVEILPAYNSETGRRDLYDEVAGCQAEVLEVLPSGEVRLFIRGVDDDLYLFHTRIKTRRES